jgi:hypothetical protein
MNDFIVTPFVIGCRTALVHKINNPSPNNACKLRRSAAQACFNIACGKPPGRDGRHI